MTKPPVQLETRCPSCGSRERIVRLCMVANCGYTHTEEPHEILETLAHLKVFCSDSWHSEPVAASPEQPTPITCLDCGKSLTPEMADEACPKTLAWHGRHSTVVMKEVCGGCGGYGWIRTGDDTREQCRECFLVPQACAKCGGSGKRPAEAADEYVSATCEHCGGSGFEPPVAPSQDEAKDLYPTVLIKDIDFTNRIRGSLHKAGIDFSNLAWKDTEALIEAAIEPLRSEIARLGRLLKPRLEAEFSRKPVSPSGATDSPLDLTIRPNDNEGVVAEKLFGQQQIKNRAALLGMEWEVACAESYLKGRDGIKSAEHFEFEVAQLATHIYDYNVGWNGISYAGPSPEPAQPARKEIMTAEEWFAQYQRPKTYLVPSNQPITLHSMATQEIIIMLEAYNLYLRNN